MLASPLGCGSGPLTAQPPGAALARQVGVAGAAQAAAGDQQGQRLQQVGLAAAVRAVQHADARRRAPGQRGVVAKIGQGQAVETEHGVEHGLIR